MQRQATTYQLVPSLEIQRKYSPGEILLLYKNAAAAKGVKFIAFNDSTQKFSIDSMYIPKITDILISTGIQANFVSTFNYDDSKSSQITTTNIPSTPVNYNPSDYIEYPVKSGEYAYMISQKYANSPTRWTEIIRKNTSSFLNSTSATQLKVGEILLIPKSWNAKPTPGPTTTTQVEVINDPSKPTKKEDGDDFLFLSALGYGIWKFIF